LRKIKTGKFKPLVQSKTGLVIDPYFSATKLLWLKENREAISDAIENGMLFLEPSIPGCCLS
jgi:glycerol kinase